jgi:hypothetical protein
MSNDYNWWDNHTDHKSLKCVGVTLRDAKTGIKDRYEPGM